MIVGKLPIANAYNLVSLQPWKINHNLLQPEDYYVSSLILVRLLSNKGNTDSYYQEQMNMAMEKMEDIPGHQMTQSLIRGWYNHLTGKNMLQREIILENQQETLQWVPDALKTLFEEVVNEKL